MQVKVREEITKYLLSYYRRSCWSRRTTHHCIDCLYHHRIQRKVAGKKKSIEEKENIKETKIELESVGFASLANFQIPFQSLSFKEKIGSGAFAAVYRFYFKILCLPNRGIYNFTEVAIKRLHDDQEVPKEFLQEAEIIKNLRRLIRTWYRIFDEISFMNPFRSY